MKGFIPIDIPMKPYVKAYLLKQLGEKPVIDPRDNIGNKMYDLLEHPTNERRSEYTNARYTTTVRIYINRRLFRVRGSHLNETNIKQFNAFVEGELKGKFYFLMDFCIDVFPSFEANLNYVRKVLGIDIEAWDDDSMRKDYYRYRLRTKKPLLYNKTSSRIVPSDKNANCGF